MAHRVFARNGRDSSAGQRQSLAEEELASSNDWFIRLRWIAGVGVIVAALLDGPVLKLGLPVAQLLWIGAGILLYNLAFFLITRQVKNIPDGRAQNLAYRRLALTQMTIDWLALGLLLHFSGGVESPVRTFFVFHIVIASMFFNRRTSFTFTILAIVLYLGVVLLEYFSILPHYPIGQLKYYAIYADFSYIALTATFFTGTLVILTYLVSLF